MKINLARKFTGLKTYHILVNTHAETVGDRMRLSLVAPPVVHASGDQCVSVK